MNGLVVLYVVFVAWFGIDSSNECFSSGGCCGCEICGESELFKRALFDV